MVFGTDDRSGSERSVTLPETSWNGQGPLLIGEELIGGDRAGARGARDWIRAWSRIKGQVGGRVGGRVGARGLIAVALVVSIVSSVLAGVCALALADAIAEGGSGFHGAWVAFALYSAGTSMLLHRVVRLGRVIRPGRAHRHP